ncbi:TetR/AcrR family transcriptional regulator [Staphylococcus gallinarum]|uniref:TetR/AcrR family transcriptional regulator n=1 Tax=Staphylococcus gallinarum TaxID=1293 RepID=UPI000D1D7BF0|nr:TetR/AcrR family transcriptional regulator [Staphylococcus gallinarum]PTK89608.1 TetR/AcrR family transcriptional regulator [Staphylococcus gallinarum]
MSKKKADLLEVAENLFYKYGFNGVGLKQIIQEANVATMTMYNHFSSKERLVEEVLVQREKRYWSYLDNSVESSETQPFIMAVKGHCNWLKDYSYQGDMFLRAIEDYSGVDAEIENVARGHKQRLLNYLETIAEKSGLRNGHDLAIRYTLLMEGTTSMTTLIGVDKTTDHALDIAALFVSEATKA